MDTPEELRREAERLTVVQLQVQTEAKDVELRIRSWANRVGKELVEILERYGPDLPAAEAQRFLRLLVLRSLLLSANSVNSLKNLERLLEVLFPAPEPGKATLQVEVPEAPKPAQPKEEPLPESPTDLEISL